MWRIGIFNGIRTTDRYRPRLRKQSGGTHLDSNEQDRPDSQEHRKHSGTQTGNRPSVAHELLLAAVEHH